MPRTLADGVYEHVVTRALADDLASLDEHRRRTFQDLDPAEAASILARHIAREVERALLAVPGAARPAAQIELTNALLEALRARMAEADAGLLEARVHEPRQLRAIYRTTEPPRPISPLASSTLLTRNRTEPSLGAELAAEIASADRIDVLMAFVTVGGVRALRSALDDFAQRAQPSGAAQTRLRVLTTVFTGTTELAALEMLARLPGARVKVSHDVRRTRLHAKAWLFHRETGLHTAYVGSANLTVPALGGGQEWMVKVSAADLPHVIEKFRGTFEGLWNDGEFEAFEPDDALSTQRLRVALKAEARSGEQAASALFDLRPYPFQQEILDRLEVERVVHGRMRNLVVAATGTGKTVVAAFDYQREAERRGLPPRLLFVAHRRELLEQARTTFRHVLRDGAFGELLGDGRDPSAWTHVFATIQSAARQDLAARFGAEHFEYMVIDECHHAPAESYRRMVEELKPRLLLGLTATPERSDGKSLLGDFAGHVAAELRVWHALERQLLVPFEYYGISDNTDLTRVRWSRTGYDAGELARLYTGNEARVSLLLEQLGKRVADLRGIRALAFCVSVEHAEFMARALGERGVPAMAVHGGTGEPARSDAPRKLRERVINVLCTCDLYNEGVDLPFVDTLLFLRPTSSATLFIQQLGRGLRHDRSKASCLVLDFIGQHRAEFRFDKLLGAVTGLARGKLRGAVEAGFPFLPSGCVLQLDAVARQQVLDSLKLHVRRRDRLIGELRELHAQGVAPTLARFLEETDRELGDVYGDSGGWASLLRDADALPPGMHVSNDLSRRLGWLTHVDDPERMTLWTQPAGGHGELDALGRRRYAMLGYQLEHRGPLKTAEEVASYLASDASIRLELIQLREVLMERIGVSSQHRPVPDWPLLLHRHYSRREIVAAIGYVEPGKKGSIPQGGILKLAEQRRELLFVTLDKSGKSFSPSTRYRDYAISPSLFHWETQSSASVGRESGRRYLDSPGNGWSFYLFVRTDPDAPYAFLGPVRYEKHEGDRPIAITWRLAAPMPASLSQRFESLSQG
jgi:superfamily II DNA or RNA helicase/HKD family nuclease